MGLFFKVSNIAFQYLNSVWHDQTWLDHEVINRITSWLDVV